MKEQDWADRRAKDVAEKFIRMYLDGASREKLEEMLASDFRNLACRCEPLSALDL